MLGIYVCIQYISLMYTYIHTFRNRKKEKNKTNGWLAKRLAPLSLVASSYIRHLSRIFCYISANQPHCSRIGQFVIDDSVIIIEWNVLRPL